MKWLKIIAVYLFVFSTASSVFFYQFDAPGDSLKVDGAVYASNSHARKSYQLPVDSRKQPLESNSWLELTFNHQRQPGELWSLVIPAVRVNAVVFLNEVRIGDGGRVETPVARNIRRPLIFALPDSVLRNGENQLRIQIISGPDKLAYLSPVYIGPDKSLRPAYKVHHFVRVTLVIIITGMIVLIGGTIGVLGFIRRQDKEYLYFSVCTLLWAVHSVSYFIVDIPFNDRLWDWLVFVTIGYFSVLGGVVYVHRFLGLRLPQIERPVLIAAVTLSLVMLALPGQWFYTFSYFVWHPLSQAAGTYGLLRMLAATWRRQSLELHIISASGIVLVSYAMHDLLLVFGILDWGRGYIIQYSMPFILGLFCLVLLQRFVTSINAVEEMKNTLERRVEERRVELEQTYARLQESEQQRLLAEERDRIMRDMHDGVGGQLVSTLTILKAQQSKAPEVERALQTALQDLRLMIDSLDSNSEDLPMLLGMFRSRIEPSLQAQGIDLVWDVDAIDDLTGFGSQQALHVLRILQEFVTNSLRHSGATQIQLRAYEHQTERNKQTCIEVIDNGVGLDNADTGRGIGNMRRRSEAINAEFTLDSEAGKTRMLLALNLSASD